MKYKAIFFDRDGTLVFNDPVWEAIRDDKLSEWSGIPFLFSHELFMEVFHEVLNGGHDFAPYKNVEQELKFFTEWYRVLFKRLGITEHVSERVDYLMQHLWYLKKELFEETIEALEYFKARGYKMGVISDCPPSLEMTLRTANIHRYFSSFTASSLVGVGKPHPKIFNAALDSLGVTAEESIYVDDYEVEATGAREQGFTSFLIDRNRKSSDKWTINNLRELVDFVEKLD
ncbi:HAD family hydrolase [Paenibacillus marinisediminis]